MYEINIKRKIEEITGLEDIKLSTPPASMKGDISTNAAMVSGMSPSELAQKLTLLDEVEEAFVAGPGFVNITLSEETFIKELREISSAPEDYGRGLSSGDVVFEMVSSNPTGPLHIGHGRGGAIGDALSRMYERLGYDVYREYYVNDSGRQMRLLGESVFAAINGLAPPEDGYKGDYIKDVSSRLKDCRSAEECTEKAGALILKDHISVLKSFRVYYDNIFPESDLVKDNLVVETVDMLKEKGFTYEMDGAIWFRSTDFGDDRDRVLRKNDGVLTYFAADCAYHLNKASRFSHLVNIWGADHHGYLPRVRAFWDAAELAPHKKLEIILYQLVDLKKGGEKVSMSTRQGEFITLREVIEEVGADATRFFMLMRGGDAQLEFDLDLAKKQNKTNPVYYVQYSHARICSVFRKAGVGPDELDYSALSPGAEEKEVIKILAHFPYLLSKCVELSAPHLMTEYLRDAATAFHKYYDRVRVIGSGDMLNTRLTLLAAFKGIIGNGLELMGVSAPERM